MASAPRHANLIGESRISRFVNRPADDIHKSGMNQATATELEALGRNAAQQIAGDGTVEEVEVTFGEGESDRPTYNFRFLIDSRRARQRAGLLRIRLIQKLRDELLARGDAHYPVIQVLDRTDWDRRKSA